MATSRENFYQVYNAFIDLRLDDFYRISLGKFSLDEFKPKVEKIALAVRNAYDYIDEISSAQLDKITMAIKTFNYLVSSVGGFDEKGFINENKSIKENFNRAYELFLDVFPIIDIIAGNLKINNDFVLNDIKKLKEEVSDAKAIKRNLEELDKRYSDLFPDLEVLNQKEIFRTEALKNRKDARNWLSGIIVSLGLLVILLIVIFNYFCFEMDCFTITGLAEYNKICDNCSSNILWLEIIKAIFYRLFLISIAVYALTFSIKNYNNSMHNQTVNKHKQNSFEAALVLIRHTESNKDEIISKAAQAIFTQQKTGYLAKENDVISMNILEQLINKIKD